MLTGAAGLAAVIATGLLLLGVQVVASAERRSLWTETFSAWGATAIGLQLLTYVLLRDATRASLAIEQAPISYLMSTLTAASLVSILVHRWRRPRYPKPTAD